MAALRRRDIEDRDATLALGLERVGARLEHLFVRPLTVFVASLAMAVAFVAYLTMAVPVDIPVLARDEAHRHWAVVLMAASLVIGAAQFLVFHAIRRAQTRSEVTQPTGVPGTARPLRLEAVPFSAAAISAAASLALLAGAVLEMLPLWGLALAVLLPWLPVLVAESVRKYRSYGLFALFLIVALLQTGHLGEHSAQVTQLLMTNGDLDRSHGVFGQLDFETVHFVWDTAIWLTICVCLLRFSGNLWLWASFVFASLHETEHVYLYWLFLTEYDYYMRGGLAGIMGQGGVIGSPLARPYLHFMYNFLVTLPMLLGLWQQSKQLDISVDARRALPPRESGT